MPISNSGRLEGLKHISTVVDEDSREYEITDRRPKRRRIGQYQDTEPDAQVHANHAASSVREAMSFGDNEMDVNDADVLAEEPAPANHATPRIILEIMEKEDRWVINLKSDILKGKTKMAKEERMSQCINLPNELYTTHDMTPEEFDKFMYKKVTPWEASLSTYEEGKEWVELPFAAMLSAKRCEELGLRKIQEKIRAYLADEEFANFMMNAQLASQVKKRGNACDATIATYPGHIPEGI
jgi:hypothetical protein